MSNVLSLVSYKIFPAKSGGQKNIAIFYKYFSAFHNVICVTIKDNNPCYADYKVLNILSNSKLRYINIFYFFTIKKIIKETRSTHLIIEHPYYGWLGILLKTFCKIKLVVHSHNIEGYRFKSIGKWWWRLLLLYERYVHQHADETFCITEEDRQFMISHFKIDPQKCIVTTYGIEHDQLPNATEKARAKKILQAQYAVSEKTILYFFNGTLDYLPNLTAVKTIVNDINPLLQTLVDDYKIIICGKNLPVEMEGLKTHKNIIYAGFVDDIEIYFKGTDVFINPITEGGGIKTKLVEALGYDLTSVSTKTGAIGVDEQLCNGKLLLVVDGDWKPFASKMKEAAGLSASVTEKYFEHFYWKNIAKKAASKIDN
jgi:glycosyltransferase involved in cell wall biosynthesis